MTRGAPFNLSRQIGSAVCLMCALLFSVLFLASLSLAQGPDTLWTRTYGGDGDQWAASVQQTGDGGYMVAGVNTDSLGADPDFLLLKVDESGNLQWSRRYGGDEADVLYGAQQTADGGYVLAGYTDSFGSSARDMYVVKTDDFGDTVWTRVYGGIGSYIPYVVRQVPNRGYLLAGRINSSSPYVDDAFLMKLTAGGDSLWMRTYGRDYLTQENVYDICLTRDGGYALCGSTKSRPVFPYLGWTDFFLIRTDELGDTLWTKAYGTDSNDVATSIQQTEDGGFILAGWTERQGTGLNIYVVRTDSLGNAIWTSEYDNSSGDDMATNVFPMSDGAFVIAGSVRTEGRDWAFLMKLSGVGDTLWTRRYSVPNPYEIGDAARTNDGGYVLAGDFLLVPDPFTTDIHLVKTARDLSAFDQFQAPVLETFLLYPNYPNPFNTFTQIAFDLPKAGPVKLKVFDLLGREVTTLADGMRVAGYHTVLFDGINLPSGIYLYRIETGSVHEAKKMVLLK